MATEITFSPEQERVLAAEAASAGVNRQDLIRLALGRHLGREDLFVPVRGGRPGFGRKGVPGGEAGGTRRTRKGKIYRFTFSEAEAGELMALEEELAIPAHQVLRRALAAWVGGDSAFAGTARSRDDPVVAGLHDVRVALTRVGSNLNAVSRSLHLVRWGVPSAQPVVEERVIAVIDDILAMKEAVSDALRPVSERRPPRLVQLASILNETTVIIREGVRRLQGGGGLGAQQLQVIMRRLERAHDLAAGEDASRRPPASSAGPSGGPRGEHPAVPGDGS
ncbi:hypothetical protein [Azospirillum sp. B4]|uniref:hypothetical protein n=1 Tax=Azospirillum sp. B4 TaxID=95605 RepID=UPI0003459969|nr:hypothetical protein [Azospirillum sp. B4]